MKELLRKGVKYMKLSTKSEYGVRALVQIACNYDCGPLSLREISDRENISYQYLEQIFMDLRRDTLVKSVRGAKGGYVLARSPSEITVGDIVEAVEGPIAPVSCVAGRNSNNDEVHSVECSKYSACAPRGVWLKLRDRIREVLEDFTLQDLVENQDTPDMLRGE